MLRITLLRHGKTEGNNLGKYIGITDEHLPEDEAEYLKCLEFPPVEDVYISPMSRCAETAKILFPDREPIVIEEFRECDFGYFEGKTYQELIRDPAYKSWVSSGEIKSFPGGENRFDFQTRSIAGFEKAVRDAVQKNRTSVAMVVHAGTIMSILDAYGFPSRPYVQWNVDNAEGYQIRLSPEVYLTGQNREIIIDGRIIRSSF